MSSKERVFLFKIGIICEQNGAWTQSDISEKKKTLEASGLFELPGE